MIGSKPDDQKELRILNRTLRWCKDGLVFAANLRHGREVIDELGLSKSKPVSSPATGDIVTRCQDDGFKPLEEEKRLCRRIIAKLNYFAHDRLDLKYATSCLASAASSPSIGDMSAAKRDGRYLRKAPVAWQGFRFHDPRPEELLCYTDADWASDKTSRRSTSGGVVILGGGVLNCWAKKLKSVAQPSSPQRMGLVDSLPSVVPVAALSVAGAPGCRCLEAFLPHMDVASLLTVLGG